MPLRFGEFMVLVYPAYQSRHSVRYSRVRRRVRCHKHPGPPAAHSRLEVNGNEPSIPTRQRTGKRNTRQPQVWRSAHGNRPLPLHGRLHGRGLDRHPAGRDGRASGPGQRRSAAPARPAGGHPVRSRPFEAGPLSIPLGPRVHAPVNRSLSAKQIRHPRQHWGIVWATHAIRQL